jgi:hypothetical protein
MSKGIYVDAVDSGRWTELGKTTERSEIIKK